MVKTLRIASEAREGREASSDVVMVFLSFHLGKGLILFIPFIDLCYLGFGRRCSSEVPHMNLTPLSIDHDNN